MTIDIRYFATFRELAGEKSCRVDEAPATVGELLGLLSARYGAAFHRAVLTDDGSISPVLILLVNGRNVRHSGGLATPLSAGDQVSVFPMVAGG